MMILIVGPNTGAYLGPGGGSRVALNMAEIMAEAGYEVGLLAAEGLPIRELDALHGTNLKQYVEKGSLNVKYFLGKNLPHVPFPIKIRLLSAYLSTVISNRKVDLVIFHDDVPRPMFASQWPAKSLLYSHFPYMARLFFNVRDPFEVNEGISSIKDRLVRIATEGAIFMGDRPRGILIANSTITRLFMEKVWGKGVGVLYPPVRLPASPILEKKDLVTIISAIQPNKRIGDVLSGFSLSKFGRLCIIGQIYNQQYYDLLLKRVAELGLTHRVDVITDADDIRKASLLSQSKIILSASYFEPFGLSILEGMSKGCVPIVYRSELSGPWIDICDKGSYGFSYQNPEDLAASIDELLTNPSIFNECSARAIKRSEHFNYEQFSFKWLKIIEACLSNGT